MVNKPKVSILCITYNQDKFIRQTLESFVMQKTNFEFEVVIGDDHSLDNTRGIIKEFEQKYPKIIKPIYREKNIGAIPSLMDVLCHVNGDYIALCEGDDFFTDENKLQLQADFLDKNPGYSICFHPVQVFFENNEEKDYIYPEIKDASKFTVAELLKENFIQTNSVMYRKQIYNNMPTNILPGDWYLHLYHAKFGRIGFIDKVMSAYRRHPGGLWWNANENQDELFKKSGINFLAMRFELLKIYGDVPEYKKTIVNQINHILNKLIAIDKNDGTKLIKQAISEFPVNMEVFSTEGSVNKNIEKSRCFQKISAIYYLYIKKWIPRSFFRVFSAIYKKISK